MTSHKISLLIAESNTADRHRLKEIFTRYGCDVIEAENGNEALRAIHEQSLVLICLNVTLVDADLQQIGKEAQQLGNPLFLLIGDENSPENLPEEISSNTCGYLHTPYSVTDIKGFTLKNLLLYAEARQDETTETRELEALINKRTNDLLCQNQSYEREILRRQEQERKANYAVKEWRATLDALPEMIAIIDDERRFRRVNKPMLDFLGIEEDELTEMVCSFCISPSECRVNTVVDKEESHNFEIFLEDKQKYLEINVVPYSSPDGEFNGSIHVFRDISKQKSDDMEKEQLQAKLLHAQKLESVGQLAAGIAHEINTPSQFVTSNVSFIDDAFEDLHTCLTELSESLSHGPISQEQYQAALQKVDWDYLREEIPAAITQSKEGLARISSIVRAMKEFSHPGSREKATHDINHLLDITVTVARNEWKYSANVELDLAPDLPQIKCLADDLGQVFLNLLVNAAHAIQEKIGRTPERDKGKIRITTRSLEEQIEIAIEDDGNGIPPEIQKKIFDPFFTTKSVGKGTGQGLAIAYDVITNKHDGTLTCTSTPGVGTTFIIRLPHRQD